MSRDSMTAEDRLAATIGLKPADRVVCAPETGNSAGQYVGISNKEFVWEFTTKGLLPSKSWPLIIPSGTAAPISTVLPALMWPSGQAWEK
ncbi:hypothetical protein [Acetonema longum]|uniref:Uncharacterized protein n=1 Tax=Acetonema longum DSM 6540 TaxID=1009370 RepID=F7NN53_9FIRM|nr:hypothetical protein [Acetonema longum]EGO62519.1 hypothetical protein ALO_17681 [Acetonema longum DSM 6540]